MDRKRKKKDVKGQAEAGKLRQEAATALAVGITESRVGPDKGVQPLTQIAILRQQRAERKKERELQLKQEEQRLTELAIAEAELEEGGEEEYAEKEVEPEQMRPSVQPAEPVPSEVQVQGVIASESEAEVEETEADILELLGSDEEGVEGFGWSEWRGEGEWAGEGEERPLEELEVEEEEEEEMEVELEAEEEVGEEVEEPTGEAKISESEEFLSLLNREVPEEDELKLIFMDRSSIEEEPEQTVADYPGVVGLDLSKETLAFFELEKLSERDPPYAYISVKRIKLHIYTYREKSEFSAIQELFKNYPDQTMLLGLDFGQATGHPYYFCTTIEARNLVINPPRKKRKIAIDAKQKEEEAWDKLSSIVPRKWKSLGSEVEVDEQIVKNSRPLLTVFAYRFLEHFGRPVEFADWTEENNKNVYVEFRSMPQAEFPYIESLEVDVGVQVVQEKTTSSSQTGYSFKRNKIVQYENQFLDLEKAQVLVDLPVGKITKRTKALQRALIQNEALNATPYDCQKLKASKGQEVEANEPNLLQEYQAYNHLKHSKNRCVTKLSFHPTLEDIVITSICEDATFDARIDLHSKTLMEPNFVLFWNLREPVHPHLMLDAPSDVFSFQVSPTDPQIICGGCANGQVALWDLGRLYNELKAHIQDRKKQNSKDIEKKAGGFLEKLKDKTEKYECPLLAPVALSNLDHTHKKAVTSICWLPTHVELGKNGTLYENTIGGKSVQFLSTAADGTILVWDLRAPKAGQEEYEVDASKDIIKVNPWVHLQNNLWKYSIKFLLDDGSGTMFASILSLSEPNKGELASTDARPSFALSTSENTSVSLQSNKGLIAGAGSSGEVRPSILSTSSKHSATSAASAGEPRESVEGEEHRPNIAMTVTDDGEQGGSLRVSNALTSIFIGTENGQVGLVDWLKDKDGSIVQSATITRTCQNMYLDLAHDGSITCIARSPFYNSLILVVGGGTISIWKENSGHPLVATGGSEYFPWVGCFSNTRPAVFFIGTREGAVQVWDLTQKSHAPVLIQHISPGRITSCALPKVGIGKKPFIAFGDSVGNVFAMILPRVYHNPTQQENLMMLELMNREEKRLTSWTAEAEVCDPKIKAIHAAWKEARKTSTETEQLMTELKLEDRLGKEYAQFLEFEAGLVSALKNTEPAFEQDRERDVEEELEELVNSANAN